MKSVLGSLAFIALCIAAMAEGITRYKIDPPAGAIVIQDRQGLNDMVRNNPETILNPENGGYYLKTMDGETLAIAGDELCVELDAAVASVDALDADAEHEETNTSKRGEDLDCPGCGLENYCRHPRCFNSALCLSYSYCHVCLTSSRKVCI